MKKDQFQLLLVALLGLLVGLAFLEEPGFGDDLTYWGQGLEVHERGELGWDRGSFHDLRWPVWGVCWALQRGLGFGIASFYGEPLLYLALGAMLAYVLGKRLLDKPAAGWAAAMGFLFHPLIDPVCHRPMPDLSEGVLGAATLVTWWLLMNAEVRARQWLWMAATGLLVYVTESNRVTGAFIVPVLIANTLLFFRARFFWLVGAGIVSAGFYAGEAVFYHHLFGDWLHNIHANMNNAGNKGTEPIPLWTFPFRFADAFWAGGPLVRIYTILTLLGFPYAWRRLGVPGRIVVVWLVGLYLEYSCTPQPVWPIRPLIRDADRFLAGLAIPMSLVAACGVWWLREKILAWKPVRIPAWAVGLVALMLMGTLTKRNWFDLGFVPEFRAYLRSLPPGTKVFTHESMRAIAMMCDADAVAKLDLYAPSAILQSSPDLEKRAAECSEFWYARKLVWLGTRKALEKGALPKQPKLGSYFDEPERDWTLVRLFAKGDTPDLIFYRRRTTETPKPVILGADAPELKGLLPAFPHEWKVDTDPKQSSKQWAVPKNFRGQFVRLETTASSPKPETFTLRLKFRKDETPIAEYLLKPYLHPQGGKEFFVFTVPADADRCDFTLKFNSKAKSVKFENLRVVLETPPKP